MARNHYGGVRGQATVKKPKPQEESLSVSEELLLLKQNQQLLIDSIRLRDSFIQDLAEKLPEKIADSINLLFESFSEKLEEKLSHINLNVDIPEKLYDNISKEGEHIFINPMDSGVGLEKSFEGLGKESATEDGASTKKSRLKELLGK